MATVYKFGAKFPAPIRMANALDSAIVLPKANFPVPAGGGGFGACTQDMVALMATAFAAALTAGKIVLFTNSIDPGPGTVFADLVEPTGAWYVQTASVIGQVFEESDGSLSIAGASKQFNHDGLLIVEDIVGWAYVDVTA